MSRLASKHMLNNESQQVGQEMSEHVRLIANSVYEEFEKLMTIYGPNIVETLMPVIVSVLENLDELYKAKALTDLELESLRNDFEMMEKQYEKEKSLRKQNEQKLLNVEFQLDEEKKNVRDTMEKLELSRKNVELRSKKHSETMQRYEDKLEEMKQENSKLYDKYTDLFRSHGEIIAKLRHSGAVNSPLNLLSPSSTLHKHQGRNYTSPIHDNLTHALFFDGAITRPHSSRFDVASTVSTQVFDDSDDDFGDLEDASCDNKSGIDSELDNTDDEFGGIRKEIESLVKENQELHDTKNALNVVKDDLISKVDLMTSNNDILTEEIHLYVNKVHDLTGKLSLVEDELHKTKLALQNALSTQEENETFRDNLHSQGQYEQKTFSRSEMAVLLQERNYFKEKYIELQDALLYTETMRVKNKVDTKKPPAAGNQSSLWNFFRSLLKTEDVEPMSASINERVKNIRSRGPSQQQGYIISKHNTCSTSITSSHKGHVALISVPRFRMESGRSQLYTWSVPSDIVEHTPSLPRNLPIPVRNQRLFDPKDSVVCMSPGYEATLDDRPGLPDHYWCLLRSTPSITRNSNYLLTQLTISPDSELVLNYSLKLKFPTPPVDICEVPSLIFVIKGLNKLQNPPKISHACTEIGDSESDVEGYHSGGDNYDSCSVTPPSPPTPESVQPPQPVSPIQNGKVVKVHQTKLLISSRPKLHVGSKTVWIVCDKNQLIVYVMFDNNKMEGRMATLTIPGSPIVTVKYHQGRVLILQKNGKLCLFSLNKDLNQWDLNQCISFDLTKTKSTSQSESSDENDKFTDYEFQPTTIFNYATNQLWLAAYNRDMKIKNWIFVFDLVTNSVHTRFPVETANQMTNSCISNVYNASETKLIVAMEMLESKDLVLVSVSSTTSILGFDSLNFHMKFYVDMEAGIFELIEKTNGIKSKPPSAESSKPGVDMHAGDENNNPSNDISALSPPLTFTKLCVDRNDKLWLVTDTGLIITLNNGDDADFWGHLSQSGVTTAAVLTSRHIFVSAHAFVRSISCLSLIQKSDKQSSNSETGTVSDFTSASFPLVMMVTGSSYLNLNNTALDTLPISNHAVVWKV